jgi:hypothetical protein
VILGLDFESYYSTALKYSLRKMNMIEYICDPRFEVIGCAFREDHDEPYWVDGPDVGRHLQSFNWELTTVVGHNLQFDASIASWVYGIQPKLWFCTLAAARTLWQHRLKYLSLAKLAEHFGFPSKGTTVVKVDGMTRDMIIEAGLYDEYVDYSLHDVTLSMMLYELAKDHIPVREMVLADSVLRLTTEPRDEDRGLAVEAAVAHKSRLRRRCVRQRVETIAWLGAAFPEQQENHGENDRDEIPIPAGERHEAIKERIAQRLVDETEQTNIDCLEPMHRESLMSEHQMKNLIDGTGENVF